MAAMQLEFDALSEAESGSAGCVQLADQIQIQINNYHPSQGWAAFEVIDDLIRIDLVNAISSFQGSYAGVMTETVAFQELNIMGDHSFYYGVDPDPWWQ